MSEANKIDDIMLAAFVDNQLDNDQRETIISAMDEDKHLREQVYDLRKTKDLIKLSFADENLPETSRDNYTHVLLSQCLTKVAAAFTVMAIGLASGFAGYQFSKICKAWGRRILCFCAVAAASCPRTS